MKGQTRSEEQARAEKAATVERGAQAVKRQKAGQGPGREDERLGLDDTGEDREAWVQEQEQESEKGGPGTGGRRNGRV